MNQSMASYLKQMKFVLIIIKQEIKIPKLKNKNKIALFWKYNSGITKKTQYMYVLRLTC